MSADITEQYQRYFDVDMQYRHGSNNQQIGKSRREYTLKIVGRFGMTIPLIIAWLYGMSKAQALVHLNKLVQQELLELVPTHRSPDERVYILSRSGAIYAEELTGMPIYFRVAFKPVSTIQIEQKTINQNGELTQLSAQGRHDPCVVPRAVPIVEAMAALVIADYFLQNKIYS